MLAYYALALITTVKNYRGYWSFSAESKIHPQKLIHLSKFWEMLDQGRSKLR
jgi:hypothetical protein